MVIIKLIPWRFMMAQKIQRVDTIPLIIAMLTKMGVEKVIDSVFTQHGNWSGLSYGQLTVLFVTYVLHSLTHRFSGMESWVNQHKAVIERVTGWQVGEKDATDDRLGRLSEVLGGNDEDIAQCQDRMGQGIIGAYKLPTQIVRYDTTSFNVYHHPDNGKNGILEFGHSKNYRSDLLQFKQGLATLDPAGVPILSETFCGNRADDPCYLPAWRRMVKTIGSADFLFIADCKAASLQTRSAIDHEKGYYLFPLPMTGETPRHIKALVLNPDQACQEIVLAPKQDQDDVDRVVGKGFVVNQPMEARLENGAVHQWQERWMVSCSHAHAKRREKSFQDRLDKAEDKLSKLKAKTKDTADSFRIKAGKILQALSIEEYLRVEINETVTTQKKYIGKGRPGPKTPFEMVDIRSLTPVVHRNEEAIEQFRLLAGWRIFVTNVCEGTMTLNQSTQYYRDEWLVERGFHRFKKGHIPALPLFLRLPERIKGLMLMLTIALQVLTLMEFVSRMELSKSGEPISGLVPGNPKMKTNRPTAERLLSQFDNLHLLLEEKGKKISGVMVEDLTFLQKKILSILQLPEKIYDLSFKTGKKNSA
jgi:transposase